jgi:coniferyl-aldehyde dehydrogenase
MALDSAPTTGMAGILAKQKAAHIRDGIPSAAKRTEWLDKAIDLLITYNDELVDAMCQDFGHRSKDQSGFTDIAGSIGALKHAKKHLAKWMRPDKRKPEFPLGLLGARGGDPVPAERRDWRHQPVELPGESDLRAAGRRVRCRQPLHDQAVRVHRTHIRSDEEGDRTVLFDEEEVAVITGGPEIGAEFTKLAFDHILFTGATSIAHHVMRAAADNLVPLTLELGGKSPVVLGRSADLQKAATRIMAGKALNAGQICLAPDYAFRTEGKDVRLCRRGDQGDRDDVSERPEGQ